MAEEKGMKSTPQNKAENPAQAAMPKSAEDVLKQDKTGDIANKGFLDLLYEKITGVIGGDNADQYFCMTLPGTIVDPEQFSYDTGGLKPAHVKANESHLVNKMFDAAFVTSADNGKVLPNQYKTALSMLTPKLNKDLFELKNRLREVLMTTYPYDFGDGKGVITNMTVEQVFYRLYNEYVEAKSEWNHAQIAKKDELERLIIDKVARDDKYLEWYGAVAETERVKLEEKLGKVLNVFSPSDMDIINAILNCGVGGEIQQARSVLGMVEELSPDGGYVYPVSLQPDNWFELLKSSFTGTDLLESPSALSQKLRTLQMQRKNILNQVNNLISTIPSDEEFDKARSEYEAADRAFKESTQKCVDTNLGATIDVVNTIVDMCIQDRNNNAQTPDEDTADRVLNKDKSEEQKISKEKIRDIVNKIGKGAKECSAVQAKTVAAGEKCVTAAIEWCESKNKKQLRTLLVPLQENLASVNDEIEEIKAMLAVSKAVQNKSQDGAIADIMPNKSDDMFTEILISSKMSAVSTSSSKESESSSSNTNVSFFMGGYSSSSSHQKSVAAEMQSNANMDIQIGMNVAKVQIERAWFNPGVFQLTGDMFSFSDNKIAPDSNAAFNSNETDAVKERFKKMNESILPSYPVAFVIAKDVSIRFSSDSGISSSFAEAVEDHASKGGGFLCFSSNRSSSSSSGKSAAVAKSTSNDITVRFTAPQILGYYMQATPEDKSIHINATDVKEMSVIGFVSDFKLMMDDFAEKAGSTGGNSQV